MINARAETLLQKPSFKNLLLRRRYLIPSDGFYEWKKTEDGKQPMRIMLRNQEIFSFAGLHDTWKNPDTGECLHSCTIITTKPNSLVESIHNRMPVILDRESEAVWLNTEESDPHLLQDLLVSFDETQMKAYPVHKMVGNVRNDVPTCILPLSDE